MGKSAEVFYKSQRFFYLSLTKYQVLKIDGTPKILSLFLKIAKIIFYLSEHELPYYTWNSGYIICIPLS